MASPFWELRKAVYAALAGDLTLTTVLGGERVYDKVPRGAAHPYVAFGPSTTRDWSTGTESGGEHLLTIRAWSKADGDKETWDILEAVRGALHEADIEIDGHRLVSLRHEASEAMRGADGESYQGVARFRAVTEPA